jgi:hypothetical protein
MRRTNLVQLGRSLQLTGLGLAVTDVERPNPLGAPVPVRCLACSGRAGAPVLLSECTCYDHLLPAREADRG